VKHLVKILISLLAALTLIVASAATVPAKGSIEVALTPWDDAEGALLRAVRSAHHAIYVQAYLLTSRSLAKSLIEAKQRGIVVEILVDRDMSAKPGGGSQLTLLAAAGIPVFIETRYAAAHNKIILVDPEEAQSAVVTGSYNFTFAAQARNAENLLIIRDKPELAMAYLHNWRGHRAEAQALADVFPAPD
jgi:phosphatidylserine/phosphatidylglycerophosphate/cardiolipin synthase-like enzyme